MLSYLRTLCLFAVAALFVSSGLTTPAEAGSDFTHFGELTEDAEHQSGFFDIYTKKDDIYLEIPLDRLEEPFLHIQTLSKGIGMRGINGGTSVNIFEALMLQFERHGDRIFLVELNPRFRGPEGSPVAKAVSTSFGNSVLASFKIESERHEGDEVGVPPEKPEDKKDEDEDGDEEDEDSGDDESAEEGDDASDDDDDEEEEEEPETPVTGVVIDFGSYVLSDVANVGLDLSETFDGGFSLDESRSAIESIKVFPKNAEFEVNLTFKSSGKQWVPTVPDSRYVPIGMHYSFSELPEEPMMSRLADDRVGYFMTVHKDFSRDTEPTFFVRYINRWRLEKKKQGSELSEPVKPIVYYVENTIPKEYRKYVKEGIELWQDAFEEAGFKKAIIAKDQPNDDDWAAEDVRYSTVRWITSHNPSYGAIGPSRVDPRTGEILDADILFEANMIRGFRAGWRSFIGAGGDEGKFPWEIAAEQEEAMGQALMSGEGPAQLQCSMGHGFVESGAFLQAALAVQGKVLPGEAVPIEYVGEAIRWVTAHEVGHTLGLRHNFGSSRSVPFEKLHDKTYVKANGLYGSVMDYPVANVAGEGKTQGYYYSPSIGTYDRWVIRYGYTPVRGAKTPDDELQALRKIAAESTNPLHAYGTDEDAYLPGAGDPLTNTFDLSSNPLAYSRDRAQYLSALWPKLESRVIGNGDSYSLLTNSFASLMSQYYRALNSSARYIGGEYLSRAHKGDPGAKTPFTPASAADQREALAILTEYGFSEEPFALPADFISKLGAENLGHWGSSVSRLGRRDFPYHQAILSVQGLLLRRITSSYRLEHLVDSQLQTSNAFTIPELFGRLNQSIWSEAGVNGYSRGTAGAGGANGEVKNIPSLRRGLQRMWVDRLIDISLDTKSGPMSDARSVARMTLVNLKTHVDGALASGQSLDDYTRAHLMDSSTLIAKALDAGYEAEILNSRK